MKEQFLAIIALLKEQLPVIPLLFPTFVHTPDSQDDEGDGEDLAHVDWERGLEGLLDLLGVFDEEAEGEDIGQAEAEIPACAHLWVMGVR